MCDMETKKEVRFDITSSLPTTTPPPTPPPTPTPTTTTKKKSPSANKNRNKSNKKDLNSKKAKKKKQQQKSPKSNNDKQKIISRKQIGSLLIDAEQVIAKASKHIDEARSLADRAGMTVDSSILAQVRSNNNNSTSGVFDLSKTTTGGHCNTDHVVIRTGDKRKDRIAELKRNMLRRARNMQPENRGEDRWDKPKVVGERRRRIIREKDLPEAPPEPPPSGYIIFVAQMTTKLRHDRPNIRHSQTKVVQEISKIWRLGLSQEDREYYNDFSMEARNIYERQHIEFRATGKFAPSTQFVKLDGANLWVRSAWHEKNGLEREIAGYDSVTFPKRPPEFDEEYERNLKESKVRRKLKIKGLMKNEMGEIVTLNGEPYHGEVPNLDEDDDINNNSNNENDPNATADDNDNKFSGNYQATNKNKDGILDRIKGSAALQDDGGGSGGNDDNENYSQDASEVCDDILNGPTEEGTQVDEQIIVEESTNTGRHTSNVISV